MNLSILIIAIKVLIKIKWALILFLKYYFIIFNKSLLINILI